MKTTLDRVDEKVYLNSDAPKLFVKPGELIEVANIDCWIPVCRYGPEYEVLEHEVGMIVKFKRKRPFEIAKILKRVFTH